MNHLRYILILLLNLFILTAYAETPIVSEDEMIEITISEKDVGQLEQVMSRSKEQLENTCSTFQTDLDHLQELMDNAIFTGETTPEMFAESVQKRQDINFMLEKIRGSSQYYKGLLEERYKKIALWSKTLHKLKTTPDEQLTEIQKQFIPTLEKGVVLVAKAIYITEQYLGILTKQSTSAIRHAVLATRVHALFQASRDELLIKERERALASTQAALESAEEKMQRKQEEIPNQLVALEAAQATADMIRRLLDEFKRERETADVEVKNLALEQKNIEANLERQQKNIETLAESLENLKKTPPIEPEYNQLYEERIASIEKHLALQTKIFELEKKYLNVINQRIKQTEKRLEIEIEWDTKITALLQNRRQQEIDAQLQEEQQRYLSEAAELRWQLSEVKEPTHRYLLEMQIQQANEFAQKLTRKSDAEHMKKRIERWKDAVDTQKSAEFSSSQLETFQLWIDDVNGLLEKVKEAQTSLQGKIDVLSKQLQMVEKRCEELEGEQKQYSEQARDLIANLKKSFQDELDELAPLEEQSEKLKTALTEAYKESIGQALFSQRQLPTSAVGWKGLWDDEYKLIPSLLVQQANLVWADFSQAFQQTEMQHWLVVGALIFLWLGFMIWVKIYGAWVNDPKVDNFASRLTLLLRLIQMNILGIALIGGFLIIVWLIQPNIASVMIVLIPFLGWLISKLLINLSWLLLSEDFPKQRRIYRQFRGIVIFLGLFAVLIALMHQEHEGLSIKFSLTAFDVIDSVFMVLLFSILWTLNRVREAVFTALGKHENVKGYTQITAYLITFLMPLSILVVSFLGLIGFIQLSWLIIKQVSLFFLVLVGWLIVRGFVDDLMMLWRNRALKRGRILLAEDFIPLFDKIAGILLFIQAAIVLLYISGGANDVAFKEGLENVLTYKLFSVGSNEITLGPILLSFVLLWIVFWLGGWSRGISYRWVYAGIADQGVRHSLSIFTQYAVVIFGLLIALKSIGIDPTMLTVFAGALGVGIGFGMQNLVNNFISGILLLIERPVRTGDFAHIDGYSGTVTRIGIRSLTLETADMEEVLVPNSSVISHSFVNRTHSNTLLRQTFYIGISYSDSPQVAKRIIKQVIEAEPEALKKPAPDILLWEFSDFRMTFRVNYFVDTAKCARFEVNSGILDKVLALLREAGIEIPSPKEDVNLRVIEDKVEKPSIIMPLPRS